MSTLLQVLFLENENLGLNVYDPKRFEDHADISSEAKMVNSQTLDKSSTGPRARIYSFLKHTEKIEPDLDKVELPKSVNE